MPCAGCQACPLAAKHGTSHHSASQHALLPLPPCPQVSCSYRMHSPTLCACARPLQIPAATEAQQTGCDQRDAVAATAASEQWAVSVLLRGSRYPALPCLQPAFAVFNLLWCPRMPHICCHDTLKPELLLPLLLPVLRAPPPCPSVPHTPSSSPSSPSSLPRSYNIKRNEFEPEWDFEAETIISELADFK